MRAIIASVVCAALLFPLASGAQTADEQRVIKRANEIMHNIYMDLWRIRDGYQELSKFGPENVSSTPELPYQYQSINCIRFKRQGDQQGTRGRSGLPSNTDEVYIGFSGERQAVGTFDEPTCAIYVRELRLFLLVYSRSDNRFFEHAVIKIVRKNGRSQEEY